MNDDEIIKRKPARSFQHLSKVGAAPGSLNVDPSFAAAGTSIVLIAYDENEFIEHELTNLDEIAAYLKKYPVTWIDVAGMGDINKIEELGKIFHIHALAMEDVVSLHQRPKFEAYKDNVFAVTRMPSIVNDILYLEQVSIFWGDNYVVTFKQHKNDCLDPLRNRMKHGGKRQKLTKPDYLAYAMFDTIIDSYFPILEYYGFKIDHIEEDAVTNPSTRIIVNIHEYKRDLLALRRDMWSQREALRALHDIGKFSDSEMKFYLRDCEDHTIQLIDILESYRERTSGLMDVYLSSVTNKMNAIIKLLTIISTIFMPLSFIASLYGMNYNTELSPWNMPELNWYYGYPYALGLMLFTASGLIFLFWRRGWLRKN